MKATELLRILRRRANKLAIQHEEEAGKGSHLHITHGGRMTVLPMHRGDLKTGLYRGILRDLGLKPDDLEY